MHSIQKHIFFFSAVAIFRCDFGSFMVNISLGIALLVLNVHELLVRFFFNFIAHRYLGPYVGLIHF